jgi:biopolymer transport protein ExbD
MAKLRKHEVPEDAGINMTPLIDVVFQLLLFFMLASSLIRPNKIELDLPESSSGVKAATTRSLDVAYLLRNGQPLITLNGEMMASLEKLGARMKAWEGEERQEVALRIQKEVSYQEVIALIDTVRDAGFPKFSLHTLAPSKTGKP